LRSLPIALREPCKEIEEPSEIKAEQLFVSESHQSWGKLMGELLSDREIARVGWGLKRELGFSR
jgi:hypothetical protein